MSEVESLRARVSARVGRMQIEAELDTGPETLVIVGPNGAGKSSLLSLLLGVLPIERGQVVIGPTVLFDDEARVVALLDEPPAALGVKEGNMVLELIRRVRDKGLPVILISHNMPHVFEVADRIHVARLGKRGAVLNPKKISMSDTVAVMTGAMPPEKIPAECLA